MQVTRANRLIFVVRHKGKSAHVFIEPHIDILFASESPQALILRRGPSDWVHLLQWHTDNDVVNRGAWFHGRIDAERCSLSPDGNLFVYFAVCHRKSSRRPLSFAWTAISKPPWLTALIRWPQSDTWGGGGAFNTNHSLFLNFSRWRHWLFRRGRIPASFSLLFSSKNVSTVSKSVPTKCFYENAAGIDQQGRAFALQHGCLVRRTGDQVIQVVDLSDMYPDPQPSPQHARVW